MYPDVETMVTLGAWRRAEIRQEVHGAHLARWAHAGQAAQAAEEGRHAGRRATGLAPWLRGVWMRLAQQPAA